MLCGAATIAAPLAPPGTLAAAEFWFVEANEGQSAGGHAALRLGPRVYHLEHRGDGLIADRRTSPRRFLEIYSDRGNRRIEAIPLDLSPAQILALEEHLRTRFFARSRKLRELDALEDEIRWLASVEESGTLSLPIPGIGLFEAGRNADLCPQAPHAEKGRSILEALRIRLTSRFGRDALRDRQVAARRETRSQVAALLSHSAMTTESTGPVSAASVGLASLLHAARTEFALNLVLGCEERLRAGALLRTETPLGADRAVWVSAQNQIAEEIEALFESPRADIGLPLLLAWARTLVITQTLSSNWIHVLAPFEEYGAGSTRAFTQSSASVANEVPPSWRNQRAQEAAARFSRSLADLAEADGPLEARLLGIERAYHALRHLEEQTLHEPVRPESRSPSAADTYATAHRILPWPSDLPFTQVSEAKLAREKSAASLRSSLEGELRYGLFTRNCVTELSAALQQIPPREDRARRADEIADDPRPRLFDGEQGRLSPLEVIRGAFIPEVVALRVESVLASQARHILPSTRELALDQAREKIRAPLSRWLFEGGEFITLTSRTYRPNQDDSRFLFFADGPVALRPLIGIANLGYGAAASLLGLFEAPFDRGVGLRRGMQGVLMSVPELFFFQVRQGSYRVAPPRALAPSAGSTETR